jgi:hypothetical protein
MGAGALLTLSTDGWERGVTFVVLWSAREHPPPPRRACNPGAAPSGPAPGFSVRSHTTGHGAKYRRPRRGACGASFVLCSLGVRRYWPASTACGAAFGVRRAPALASQPRSPRHARQEAGGWPGYCLIAAARYSCSPAACRLLSLSKDGRWPGLPAAAAQTAGCRLVLPAPLLGCSDSSRQSAEGAWH